MATIEIIIIGRDNVSQSVIQARQALQSLGQTADRTQRQAGAAFGNMARQAATFTAGLAAFNVLSGVMNVAKDAIIGFNAQLEQSQIGWTTMLGSAQAARTMIQDMAYFAAVTPFEFPGLEASARRMMAMGFAARDIIPILTDIGNVASGMGQGQLGIDRMTLALGQMRAKGRVMGDELRQLTEAGVPALRLIAQHLGITTDKARDMAEKGQISANTFLEAFRIWSQANFGGMMEKQAKTFIGAMSTIADNVRLLASTAFMPIFNVLSQFAQQMAALSTTGLGNTARNIAQVISNLIGVFEKLPGPVQSIIFQIGGLLAVLAALAPIIAIIVPLLGALTSPIGLLIAAVGALAIAWQANFLGIRDIVNAVVPWITDTTMGLITEILVFVESNLPKLIEIFQTVLDWITNAWATYGDQILDIVDTLWITVRNIVSRGLEAISQIINFVLAIVRGDWAGAWQAVLRLVRVAWNNIIDVLSAGAKSVLGIVRIVGDAFGATFITEGVDALSGSVDSLAASARVAVDDLLGLAGAGSDAADAGFKHEEAMKRQRSSLVDMINKVKNLFVPASNAMRDSHDSSIAGALEAARAFDANAAAVANMGEFTGKAGDKAKKAAADFTRFISSLVAMNPLVQSLAASIREWESRIEATNLAIAANRDQMEAAEAAMASMQERLGILQQQLSDLASPRLTGMGDLENKIHAIDQQLARMDLARKMRLPLADIVKMFPLLDSGMEDFVGGLGRSRTYLERHKEVLELTGQVKYDEQLRQIGKAAEDTREELDWTEVIARIGDTKAQITALTSSIDNQRLFIEGLKARNEELTAVLAFQKQQLDATRQAHDDVVSSLTSAYNWLIKDREEVAKLGPAGKAAAEQVDQATIALFNSLSAYTSNVESTAVGSLSTVVSSYQSAVDAALAELARIPSQIMVEIKTVPVTPNSTSAAPIEGRASGGPVLPNRTYVVGEDGPELLVMGSRGGTVINHHWNYAPSYNGAPSSPRSDFNLMRTMARA